MKHPHPSAWLSSACAVVATALLVVQFVSPFERLGAQATGAVPIVTLGAPLSQDFDGLVASGSATWVNDATIPGWYHARTGSGTTVVANNGGNNAGNLYSYGTGTATDRALGSIGSSNVAAGSFHWGVRLANQTASTITSLTVSYVGEQWRNSAAAAQTVDFSYRLGTGLGTALTDFTGPGVAVPELSFTSPVTGGTAGAIDGNTFPNRIAITHTITGLNLGPGAELLLRWSDIDHGGADHGLAIDEFSVTANGTDVPAVSINNVSLSEGNAGTSLATFTVSVSSPSHGGVSFDIATADGTATLVDGDYAQRAESGQTIASGATTYSFAVQVNGDTAVEPDETFSVNLTNVTGATLLDGEGTGTIVNDDAPGPVTADVVISQVYGGGGNAGSTLTNDFVELFNSGATPVNLAGWSIQYSSSAGATWQATPLTGSIPAGGYYLIQQGAGGGGTVPLPAPDASGTVAMAAGAGKVALRSSTAALAGACPAGLIDFVGYGGANCFEGGGPAAAPSAALAALRKRGGCFDSNNNNIDFATGTPAPRNTSSPLQSCTPVAAAIHDIQGPGLATPFAGQYVTTTGIVTALKTNGFFLQTPDGDVDTNAQTSEALFVFTSIAPAVAVGNAVSVGGTATEFFNLTQIEATLPGDVTVGAASNPVPAAQVLTSTILDPAGTPQQLEPFEGMRLYAPSLTSVAPTNEFGEIGAVLTGVARPMREPGISINDPVPPDPSSGSPDCCIPRFDENPERIFIDSDGLAGAMPISVTSHVALADVIGPLDFTFGAYKLLPETPPATSANISGLPVPAPVADELTVAGFNIENFVASNETQRRKAALAIRQLMQSPDVIGHIEILDLATLQSLADQVNADTIAAGAADPGYQAVLIPAPAGGTQNVGFLVKTSRVRIDNVSQERGAETFINPNNGQQETLHDRPPLVLRATFDPFGANPRPFIVVVNHLRSFIDIELVGGEGPRVRAKRTAQAESVAGLLQELQTGAPDTAVISIGDFNAYQFNDGYTDPIAVLKGMPTPDDQLVVDASPDLVEPNFVNLTDTRLSADQRYSFIFEGTPQALDHVLVNTVANGYVQRYAIARGNADFPETAEYTGDATRPERSSDHDMPVAYFRFPPPSADLAVSASAGATTTAGGNVTFSITATNNGPFAAQNVVVSNHLSPQATLVSCAATGGGVCNTTSAPTVTFATLAPGATQTITLVAALPCSVPNAAVIVNMATISSDTADSNSSNNAAAASTVADNAAPSLGGVAASRTRILLPLHEMVPVTVSYNATDTCGPVTTTLAVTSDEPVTGPLLVQGLAGLTSPDWQVVDTHRVRLRAERSLSGDGRVYTITITATDAAGGQSTRQVTVTVPRYVLPWMTDEN